MKSETLGFDCHACIPFTICIAACQGKEADIVFVIDESTSIWSKFFEDQMVFVADLVDKFDIDSGKTQVKVKTFNTLLASNMTNTHIILYVKPQLHSHDSGDDSPRFVPI